MSVLQAARHRPPSLSRQLAFGLLTTLAALAVTSSAHAYCRTASCANKVIGARCSPELPSDCGVALFWPGGCAGYSLQKDASSQIDLESFGAIVDRAFASWQGAVCDGSPVGLDVVTQGRVSCDTPEYIPTGANANVIQFRDGDWPYASKNVLALTTVTFNLDTGEIRDADMEINTAENTFSTGDTDVTFDLLSVVTHEAGHFLGLSHSDQREATMVGDYPPMSLTLRDLSADDLAGICAIYPPGDVSECDPTPRGGLGDACGSPAKVPDGQDEESCAIHVGASPVSGTAGLVGAAVALAAFLRRRGGLASPRRR